MQTLSYLSTAAQTTICLTLSHLQMDKGHKFTLVSKTVILLISPVCIFLWTLGHCSYTVGMVSKISSSLIIPVKNIKFVDFY